MSTLKSLSNHLKVLEERHRDLDQKIADDYKHHMDDTILANEKIEKIGLIGSALDATETFKIELFSEIQSSEVPLFSQVFTPVGTSDACSFSPNVTIPEGSVVDVKIVCDKTHSPSLNIGILYGRVR